MSGFDPTLKSKTGMVRRLEVLWGDLGRRRWPDEVKAQIVLESFASGAVVSTVARRHGLTPMRYGFDGLSAKVASVLALDPSSGHLLPFRSKRGDYMKILYWDGSELCLLAKRLERGRLVWPPIADGALVLPPAQLALLVEAINWRRRVAPRLPAAPHSGLTTD